MATSSPPPQASILHAWPCLSHSSCLLQLGPQTLRGPKNGPHSQPWGGLGAAPALRPPAFFPDLHPEGIALGSSGTFLSPPCSSASFLSACWPPTLPAPPMGHACTPPAGVPSPRNWVLSPWEAAQGPGAPSPGGPRAEGKKGSGNSLRPALCPQMFNNRLLGPKGEPSPAASASFRGRMLPPGPIASCRCDGRRQSWEDTRIRALPPMPGSQRQRPPACPSPRLPRELHSLTGSPMPSPSSRTQNP